MSYRSLLAGFAFLLSSAAWAAGPSPVAPSATTIDLGSLRLTSLRDAEYVAPNDAKTFGVDVGTGPVTQFLAARGVATDVIRLNVAGLLVRGIPGHVVLIDTGLGPAGGGVLAQSLKRAGVSASQVTDVLITHAHPDHIGGLLSSEGRSAFPKATIHFSRPEWAWLQSQSGSEALVAAIGKQVRTFEPAAKVLPGITAVPFEGHTPGHSGYRIASGRAQLVDIGDTAHSSIVSLGHPEWVMGFDSDPTVARRTREAALEAWSRQKSLIFSPHFPNPGFGRVSRQGDAFVWSPVKR